MAKATSKKFSNAFKMDQAEDKIQSLGYSVLREDDTKLSFEYNGSTVYFFPFKAWATGKSIEDGRGLENLLKQIR